jgi:hypothetical protein
VLGPADVRDKDYVRADAGADIPNKSLSAAALPASVASDTIKETAHVQSGATGAVTALDYLRALSCVTWTVVFGMRSGSIWRVIRGRATTQDPLWGLFAGFALMVIGFNLRALVASDALGALSGLHLYSVLLGVATIVVTWTYKGAHRG